MGGIETNEDIAVKNILAVNKISTFRIVSENTATVETSIEISNECNDKDIPF